MLHFRSRPVPIWRRTWFRLVLLSSSTVGVVLLVISRFTTEWALAPEQLTDHPTMEMANQAESLDELYALRSQVQTELAQTKPNLRQISTDGIVRPYLSLTQLSYGLTRRILQEEQATVSYNQAIELANTALALRQQGTTLQLSQQEENIWQQAIDKLEVVNQESSQYTDAQKKLAEYNQIAMVVRQRVDQYQSEFLTAIAAERGNPKSVRISLCQLGTDECRAYQGDVPPTSLASLVKLPIAVALMHHVTSGQASLDDEIYIDPSNFTENAQGAKIFVDKTYTLREVMVRMITESNNIATNQLVDYLGYDLLNQALKAQGFSGTTVGHKLVGARTYPKKMGSGRNRSTANELTKMMMRIYSFTKDSDEEILNALVGQYDLDFGYRALVKEKPDIFWIGEKTGQNSSVIGSTVAFKVGEERYVMTVSIDKSANQVRLRQIIRDVARYVLENGPLDQQTTAAVATR